jgi:hypothetical protein
VTRVLKKSSPPSRRNNFTTDDADNTQQIIEMIMRAGLLPAWKCHQSSGALWLQRLNNLTILARRSHFPCNGRLNFAQYNSE